MKIFGHKGKHITKEIPELDTLKTELRRERYKRRFRRLLRRTVDALIVVAAIAAVIATPGDYLWIEPDGTVFVNGNALDEPYVRNKALGECDIEFPYQVP